MTMRERVLAAMAGEKPDRTPVGFWFHFPGEKQRGEACVKAHLDYYNAVDADLVKIMCDGYFDWPNPVIKGAGKAEELYGLAPLGADSPWVREQAERARAVREGLREERVVIYNVFAPFSLIRFAAGEERVARWLEEDEKAVLFALEVIKQDLMTLLTALKETGIDGVYFCVQGGELDRFSEEEYRRIARPSELEALRFADSLFSCNVLHCCGWAGVKNRLSLWADYPAAAYNWACFIEGAGLEEGRRLFGAKCVLGGFDNRPAGAVCSDDREAIRAEADRLLNETGGRGTILGADCTLPGEKHIAGIKTVIERIKEVNA